MIPREVVVDASVAVKWLLADVRGEADVPAANQVLLRVREGEVRLFQPAHFVLEIAAVLARESPRRAARDLAELQVVALSRPEALLVTADERYWRAARREGRVVRLSDFATLH